MVCRVSQIGNLNFFPVLGYVLNEDGKECVDEDECAASNNRICGNGKYHNGIAFSEIYYLVITMLSSPILSLINSKNRHLHE